MKYNYQQMQKSNNIYKTNANFKTNWNNYKSSFIDSTLEPFYVDDS